MKISKKIYLSALIAILIKIGFIFYVYTNLYNKAITQDNITIIIPKDCSIRCASDIFYKNNLVSNKFFFTTYARIFELLGKKIIAGEYYIPIHSNFEKTFDKIIKGDVIKHTVTIPEGLTNIQVIKILKNVYGVDDDIDNSIQVYKEGTLYPNTYEYLYGTKISYLLYKMNLDLQNLLKEEWSKRDIEATKELQNENDALILASIVEKEAKFDDEKPHIASVYLNRLRKIMPLQADPTVIYGISKWEDFNRKVTYDDLKTQSSYNTYLNLALPPTPICNSGKSSIKAVLNPIKSDDIYFVADNSEKHVFANNYKQHLKNIRDIRKYNK
jgi:UPF0755 protein